jgi:cell division protein FtsL
MLKKLKHIFLIIVILAGFSNPQFSYSATDNSAEIKELNDKIEQHKLKIKELEEEVLKRLGIAIQKIQ